ncbi:hypothetical protein VOLCADRAFT_94957 [Volvox carteri f. nagariensis]|uniref:Uncharacterized protein n=1 Tax=Volvox carteri f. nagariensis TaxID=3068 RepID=D8U681_VOLCA|nr:uncharacterized protein VOLCADRAFT_94957 [Volvox carteri f. nagariensis]EFJ44807.1 hypothetical protein VOLCADRAFT_94957 [Volvox carteri f. nagariensis]|eukprot:XP_002954090.1 hypothetical protein VOLCADRAFT_94957 [Volvox carteri f. nagariensis]
MALDLIRFQSRAGLVARAMKKRSTCFRLPEPEILLDELVQAPGRATSKPIAPEVPCLSFVDHTTSNIGAFGGELLFRQSINAALLKQALQGTLEVLPWFAGRLITRRDRPAFDVACNNAGARLSVGRSETTLEQLAAVLVPRPDVVSDANAVNPLSKHALPHDPWVIAKQKALQTFMAHLSGAYNSLLGGGQSGGGGPYRAATTNSDRPGPEEGGTVAALPSVAERLSAAYAPALVESFADPSPPPPGTPPRESFVVFPRLLWRSLFWALPYKLRIKGGGVEQLKEATGGRTEAAPAAAPAAAGADASEATEVALDAGEEKVAATVAERRDEEAAPRWRPLTAVFRSCCPGGNGGGASGSGQGSRPVENPTVKAAAPPPQPQPPVVEWVSTRDCLAARLAQLLHAIPLRRRRPMFFLVAVNMRPRVQPPLPAGLLGNAAWTARVDGVRASQMVLGELAARVRHAIHRDLPLQYGRDWHRVKVLAARDARRLVSDLLVDPRPSKCLLAPQGPFLLSDWPLQYGMWQLDKMFGKNLGTAF